MSITINGTTGVSGVDGTAAAPAVQGGDSNTGVFFPAADTVAITTGGSERLRVDSSGNVGIGTASPSYHLDVSGSGQQGVRVITTDTSGTNVGRFVAEYTGGGGGTAAAIDMRAGDGYSTIITTTNTPMLFGTNNIERMRIDASGNVGIGTTSPSALLDVRNGSNTGGSGTWLTKVHQNTNAVGANGLSVMNTWAASASKVLELAVAWNGTSAGYYPIFQIDGINQRFSAIYGSGGSSVGATLYPEFQCRAWVKFGGAGTIAGSGNVTSVTNSSAGRYVVSFTTAMPDANYAVSTGGTIVDSTGNPWQAWGNISRGYGTGSFTIDCSAQGTTGAGQSNWAIVTVAVFR